MPRDQTYSDTNPLLATQAKIIGRILAVMIRTLYFTWRKSVCGQDYVQEVTTENENAFIVFWHGTYASLFAMMPEYDGFIITSRSFRGEVIGTIGQAFGFDSIQVPDRTNNKIPQLFQSALKMKHCMGIALDGPSGPYHRIKPGLVHIASELEINIIPASVSAAWKITIRNRWDKFELPLPFSRVSIVLGKPIRIPSSLGHSELKKWTRTLEEQMEANDRRAVQNMTHCRTSN